MDAVKLALSPMTGRDSHGAAAAPAWTRLTSNRLEILLLSGLAAAVSLVLSGYQFGIINNLFHLPIAASLYDEPQFASDTFIQSLRYYSSGVWMVLKGSARHVPPYWLFLALDYGSRLLTFTGFLCCGSLVGVETRRERAVFAVILCFSSLLHGYSYPGNGGLFVNYFTHSEIANGTILLTIYFAARGRFTEALTLNGITFFINAFMAIWTLLPLALIAVTLLSRRELTIRALVKRGVAGFALAAIVASPVVWNVVTNPALGGHVDIDFRRFLLDYYPDHVLFSAASPRHMVALAVAIIYGFACLFVLGERAAGFRAALWGSVAIYAIGIVLPLFTSQPFFLNFHLIRSSVVIHLLAAFASGSVAAKFLCGADRNRSKFFGPLLVLADCAWRSFLPLGIATIAAAEAMRRIGSRRPLFRLDIVIAAALVLVIWPRLAWQDVVTNRALDARTEAWTAVGEWARASTPVNAVFLVPTRPLRVEPGHETATGENLSPDPVQGSEIFEFTSHRRVWVDFRRGAAVMWTPSYHTEWWQRVTEVIALPGIADKAAYARGYDIDYVIDACRNGAASDEAAAFQTHGLCVYPASALAGPGTARGLPAREQDRTALNRTGVP